MNKRILNITLLLSVLVFIPACSDSGGNGDSDNRFTTLVWSDEFDSGDSPNSENWIFDIGTGVEIFGQPGWGNNELQYYTDRPENIKVENGMLEITTRKEFLKVLSIPLLKF